MNILYFATLPWKAGRFHLCSLNILSFLRRGQLNYTLGQESILYLLYIWLSQRCWQFLEAAFNLNYHITLLSSLLFLLLTFNRNIFESLFSINSIMCYSSQQQILTVIENTRQNHGTILAQMRTMEGGLYDSVINRGHLWDKELRDIPIRNSEKREDEWRDGIKRATWWICWTLNYFM